MGMMLASQSGAMRGEISEKFHQWSIALKIGQKEILSVDPCKDYLNLFFEADISKLNDPKSKVRDVEFIGHQGVGNIHIKLESLEDIPYCIDLIKQALAQK